MKLITLTIVVGLAAFGVRADTWTDPDTGYTWTYYVNGDTARIGYGSYSYSAAISPKPTGAVTIPSTLGGKPVTSIGQVAFYECSGLTSVTIPDGVTNIASCAFCYCTNLTSVTIPDGVTSIGDAAFAGCSVLLFDMATIPGVMLVDGWAVGYTDSYSGDLNLTGVRGIGQRAFNGCSGLTSVTIGTGMTSIGDYAFSVCSNLTSVTIGTGVTSIGKYAFYNCSGLTGVLAIPDGVTSIGDGAFYNCSGLTSVTIPDSVTSIGDYAFNVCSGLTEIVVGKGNPTYSSANGLLLSKDGRILIRGVTGDVTIPDSVTRIEGEAFCCCSGLTSVTIPNSVTSIGGGAFNGCSGLTSVTIPASVTSIRDQAFYNCSGLTSVTIPNSVTSIEQSTFYGCSGLTSVTIPDSVTSIKGWAFACCNTLEEVWLPEGVNLDSQVFYGCSARIFWYGKVPLPYEHLTAVDGCETNVELTVTNICRVAFRWKCSCEPMRKGRMFDYLSFSIDGVQQDAICGETDWTAKEFLVEGEGVHVLRWTYRKDESGSAGADCGWLHNVRVAPYVTLAFLPGEATVGAPPGSMSFYADAGTVSLPGCGSLAYPRHSFVGWSDGETIHAAGADYPCDAEVTTLTAAWARKELSAPVIGAPEEFYGETATVSISAEEGTTICYTLDGSEPTAASTPYMGPFTIGATTTIRAIAVREDYFDSPEAVFTATKDATTFGGAVNSPALEFTPDDELGWRCVRGESPDGYALRSGAIGNNATSRIETVVVGEGVITFSCKVAGEVIKGEVYDGLAFLIDGVQQGELMGNADWATNTFEITGGGTHTLSWLYVKDESDEDVMPDDCAWLDEVRWTSTRNVTVTFDANGGELDATEASRRVLVCTAIGALPVPTRMDYTLLGWFTATVGGEQVTAGREVAEDATFYAHWAREVRTVSFDTNGGGAAPADIQMASGEAIGALPVVVRNNYVFLGWFTAAIGGEQVTADAAISADMTLYAHWQCRFSFGDGGVWTEQPGGSWKSGATADDSTNSISMTVGGPGTVSFRWKASCEDYYVFRTQKILLDHLAFLIDGETQNLINGETDWTNGTFTVEGTGEHVLMWAYVKDSEGAEGEDCAWLDEVTWTPSGAAAGLESWLAERSLAADARAANGRTAAECYALGLDPTEATNDFRIVSIELTDDGPKVDWEPKTNRWTGSEIRTVLKEAASLEGPWAEVPAGGGSPGTARPTMRFFKVTVEVP